MKRFSLLLYALILVLFLSGVAVGTTHDSLPRHANLFHLDQLDYHPSHAMWLIPEDDNISASPLFHNLAGQDSLLNPWQQLLDTADINFEFDSTGLTTPKKDSKHVDSEPGFGTETHSRDDKKTLGVETAPDSNSAMFFLLASGLIGLAAFGRKFRKR